MQKKSLVSSLLLLITAIVWGVAFVAQQVGMEHVGPFTFNAARYFIGGAVLLPVIALRTRKSRGETNAQEADKRTLYLGGVLCGAALFAASSFQQIGIQFTTVGKAGFITACYIVLVPVFSLFLGRKCSKLVVISVALAVAGLYLLCMMEGLSVGAGDLLVLACAALFAVHILVVDAYAPRTDCVKLSCIQFFTAGVCSLAVALFAETVSLDSLTGAAIPILYAGVFSCGVGYTLQVIGQKGLDPTVASLILSLESCVSVLAGWLILGQALSARELCGCAAMFAAIVLAQLPGGQKQGVSEKAQAGD